MADTLTPAARDAALARLPDWSWDEAADAISRTFRFADFKQAFGFMARIADIADPMDHHPDWSNSYDKVAVTLTTHDAGGLTDKDIELAAAMDREAASKATWTPEDPSRSAR